MTQSKNDQYLRSLLKELLALPAETEWAEFKHNSIKPESLGEYISALANATALHGKAFGYLVWGVEDDSHDIVGTDFDPERARHKQQELESWLLQKLEPKIEFNFHKIALESKQSVVILEVQSATHTPVRFDGKEYIRVGSYKKPLGTFPEKERALWRVFDKTPFERQIAVTNQSKDDVLKLLDYPKYFELLDLPLPDNKAGIIEALESDDIIQKSESGQWDITNLGALLFAKSLKSFTGLKRKAVRVILYKGNDKYRTEREIEGDKGYAIGFEGLIDYINTLLPSNEEIGKAFRTQAPMYPEIAIRELVANTLIHQDFNITGSGPMIEIFTGRMEITNPGAPLIETDRLLDSPPRSRNEALASLLRRMNICEERGSGIDKVVIQAELFQLPAPVFETFHEHTRAILFAYREFKDMDTQERVHAAYMHSVLRYLNRQHMNNASLRERFGIDAKNSSMVSRVIRQAVEEGRIKPYDKNAGAKAMRYVPWWS